jgi:hypothetical protein
MATFTAQILVGSSHLYHGGISPTHCLYLSENDRPAWILINHSVVGSDLPEHSPITWIPTVEDMLEDALLMIAVHVRKDRGLLRQAELLGADLQSDYLEMYSSLSNAQRAQLHSACRAIKEYPKLIVSVFEASTIESQLPVLEQYGMEVEVCCASCSRQHSSGADETTMEGSLR